MSFVWHSEAVGCGKKNLGQRMGLLLVLVLLLAICGALHKSFHVSVSQFSNL